jgi:MFS transporter, NNP family, nitrate/nitrite transporter
MRALHVAWISFFLAFTIWFAVSPLLKEIRTTLHLSKQDIWASSMCNDIAAIVLRMILGPICDQVGARWPMAIVLVIASIPTAMVGMVDSAWSLCVVRGCIGIAGSSFVMAQTWPSRMFVREISGTANGLVAGWGNLGGAFTQVFMGSVLFPLFRTYVFEGDAERSWRTVCVIPAALACGWGCIVPWISDDAPMGQYREMRKRGGMDKIYYTTALRQGTTKNTWILYVQYACCFGVELVMNNAAVIYFADEFGLSTEQASLVGGVFGFMNIVCRLIGGFLSDSLNLTTGMRGRLRLLLVLMICEGVLIIVFAYTETLAGAIITMCMFSVFTQAIEGAVYGIVPYVSKLYTGSVAGFVGSGGNVGSVLFGLGFYSLPTYRQGFVLMGSAATIASLLTFFIRIPMYAGLISGEDHPTVVQTRERYIREFRQATGVETAPRGTSRSDEEAAVVEGLQSHPQSVAGHHEIEDDHEQIVDNDDADSDGNAYPNKSVNGEATDPVEMEMVSTSISEEQESKKDPMQRS